MQALYICCNRDKQRKTYKPWLWEAFSRWWTDRFPIWFLPVEVQLKVQWEEIKDRGRRTYVNKLNKSDGIFVHGKHREFDLCFPGGGCPPAGNRTTCRRPSYLLIALRNRITTYSKVLTRYTKRIMIVAEPSPRCDIIIVIVHHPLQSLHISKRKITYVLGVIVWDLKFPLQVRSLISMKRHDKRTW